MGPVSIELTELNSSAPLRKLYSSTQGAITIGRGGRGSQESKRLDSGLFRSKGDSDATRVMSKRHAQLDFHNAQVFISDLNSTNGTFHNKSPLIPEVQYLVRSASPGSLLSLTTTPQLKDGDVVCFGKRVSSSHSNSSFPPLCESQC